MPHRGLDPLQAGLKDRSPSRRAHEASVSWPPRNRTEQHLFIRQDPSTSWVVASGCGRSRTCKAVRLARVQAGFRRRSDCLSSADGVRRMAQELNLLRTRAPTARFQRGALPVGQPSVSGERSNRSPRRSRALVSSEARHPDRFTLLGAPPRIRTANLTLLRRAPLPSWARGAWSDRPDSNWRYDHGKVAC